ncbi:MAG TPA: POTRA domain-containing protein [Bryobacteraceae bacterium]|jgi:hypothetical protein
MSDGMSASSPCALLIAFLLVFRAFANESPRIVSSVTVPGTGLEVKLATQVGRPFDASTIAKDVRYLWGVGRFDDIRVETTERDAGIAVVFRATVYPHRLLHEIRIQPNTYGLDIKVPPATFITPLSAHQIALDAQRQLNQEGYQDAHVRYEMAPAAKGQVDLKLTVDIGNAIRVKEVRLEGDPTFRRNLQALRIRRMLPGVPYLWDGWKLLPSYSPEAIDAEVAHLHSLYVAKGFFNAEVRPGPVKIHGKDARVTLLIRPGPHYALDSGLCTTLFTERREAQRQGVLDFSARVDAAHLEDGPAIELGRRYRVGRIEFLGNHHYRNATVRSNFLIEEGAVFDEYLLRKSIARLNRAMLFENVSAKNVVVQPDEKTGFADVTVHLVERKRGSWKLSGPVGPMSLAGPLEASLNAHLPPWGRGLLELSTYTASVGIFAFGRPLLPILNAPKRFTPIFALQRAFTPGEGWRSGFTLAPQLGWTNTAIGYGTTQMQQRLLPLVSGERGVVPDLNVTIARSEGDESMSCEAPKPRLGLLRSAGTMALHLLGTLPSL